MIEEIPEEVIEAAIIVQNYFIRQGIKEWEFMGLMNRRVTKKPEDSTLNDNYKSWYDFK